MSTRGDIRAALYAELAQQRQEQPTRAELARRIEAALAIARGDSLAALKPALMVEALTVTPAPESAVLVTRERLIDALTRLEVTVPGSGPLAGKVLADSFADALLTVLAEQP